MKVLLKQRVEKLGEIWDMVNVKDGFARNFLFPRGLALEATKANLKVREDFLASRSALAGKERHRAEELAKKLQGASFTLALEANADDRLYGSIDADGLAKLLESEGYAIEKKNVLLDEPIRSLGVYSVDVKVHPEIVTKIKIWVVKK